MILPPEAKKPRQEPKAEPKSEPQPKAEPQFAYQAPLKFDFTPPPTSQPKKASKLSVWAFILSFTLVATFLGIILAIVDLVKNDPERKHGLSKAALVIGLLVTAMLLFGKYYAMPKLLAETGQSQGVNLTPLPTLKAGSLTTPAPMAAGTRIYSGPEAFGLETVLTDPSWTYAETEEGIAIGRTSGAGQKDPRIMLASVWLEELTKADQDPARVLSDFMSGVTGNQYINVQDRRLKNGYEGKYAHDFQSGTKDPVTGYAWVAEGRIYLAAMVNPGNQGDAEVVFNDLVANFRPVTFGSSVIATNPPAAAANPPAQSSTASTKVVSIVYGGGTLAGLRENGTVTITGRNAQQNKMDVSGWNNIVAIDSDYSGDYVIGLRADGTVVATGDIRAEALKELQTWRNIVALDVGDTYGYVLGVRADGTVAVVNVEREPASYDRLPEKVSAWTDIASVKVFSTDVYGRKKDGTWVSTEGNYRGLWTRRYLDAAEFYGPSAGDVVRYPDGSIQVRSNSMKYDISSWRGVVKLYVSSEYAIGLKQDGTILYACTEQRAGYSLYQAADLSSWKDIVDFGNDTSTLVGLKKDGTLIFVGSSFQFSEKEWEQKNPTGVQQVRITPAPMRTAQTNDTADKKAAVDQLDTWEASDSGKKLGTYPNYSRRDYAAALASKGYSEDVIWYALEHCGIDWKTHAVRVAQQRSESSPSSRLRLEAALLRELFTEEEIAYARSHWSIDFKANAVARAQSYLKSSGDWTREKMIDQLEFDGFTHEEAVYAVGKVGLK